MSDLGRANGESAQRLMHLTHPALRSVELPDLQTLPFDLDRAMAGLVHVEAVTPADVYTAALLGTQREGTGIVLDNDGLVLTIGYLVLEATAVRLTTLGGQTVDAQVVAYDYETGFGLVRADSALEDAPPVRVGSSGACAAGDPVVVAAYGGRSRAAGNALVSRREFAGYWEYLLDEAFFTAPVHMAWSGAALLNMDGALVGLGSLYVEDAVEDGGPPLPGNMFIPIDPLDEVLPEPGGLPPLDRAPRPWLGMFTAEAGRHLVVAGILSGGPAERAGVRAGDIVLGVAGQAVRSLGDLYRKVWALGDAGIGVPLVLARERDRFEVVINSADRYEFLRQPLAD